MSATQDIPDPGRVALAKLTYGFTPVESARFNSIGLASWLETQLDPNLPEGDVCANKLARFESLEMTVDQTSRFGPFIKDNRLVGLELSETTLVRRLHSRRQLYEMLVEHFDDCLHIELHSAWQSRMAYDRDVIRANVLGSYPDMVVASSIHPAMLDYLNGNENTKDSPNQEYARELQAHHTITSSAGFRHQDVINAARVFSGISWDHSANSLAINPGEHWSGSVSVFGWNSANLSSNPEVILKVSESLVRYLAMRPETAMAFSTRLARRFIGRNPTASLLDQMAEEYLHTGGDIPSVVKLMIMSPEFAEHAWQPLKRPTEHFRSVVRVLK